MWDVGVAPGPAFEGTRPGGWRRHSKSGLGAAAGAAATAAHGRATGQLEEQPEQQEQLERARDGGEEREAKSKAGKRSA